MNHLAKLILWLHEKGKFKPDEELSGEEAREIAFCFYAQLLFGAVVFTDKYREVIDAAREIRSGRIHSPPARKLQRKALGELRKMDILLESIEQQGYSPLNVRSFLSNFYWDGKRAELGTDSHIIYVDVALAISHAGERTREIATLLAAGFLPQEIGEKYQSNGTRDVHKAMRELVTLLEGN